MRRRKSSFVWILLSIIVLLTGVCSSIERTDSLSALSKQMTESDRIEHVKKDTLYIGNCTSKLITGMRDTFQRNRRGEGRITLRNYAEFLWVKEILHTLFWGSSIIIAISLLIQSSQVAILNYIHNQDGEK